MVKKIKKEIKNFKWKKIAKKIVCQFGRAVQGGSFRCYSVIGRGFESLNWQNNLFFLFLSLIKNNQKLVILFYLFVPISYCVPFKKYNLWISKKIVILWPKKIFSFFQIMIKIFNFTPSKNSRNCSPQKMNFLETQNDRIWYLYFLLLNHLLSILLNEI